MLLKGLQVVTVAEVEGTPAEILQLVQELQCGRGVVKSDASQKDGQSVPSSAVTGGKTAQLAEKEEFEAKLQKDEHEHESISPRSCEAQQQTMAWDWPLSKNEMRLRVETLTNALLQSNGGKS